MTIELSKASRDLADRLLSEVGENDRLIGYRMHPMGGNRPSWLYTLSAAANFLHTDTPENLLNPLSGAYLGYIDQGVLIRWVEEIFGDAELAEALRKTIAEIDNYAAMVDPMKELILARLDQCLELVGERAAS